MDSHLPCELYHKENHIIKQSTLDSQSSMELNGCKFRNGARRVILFLTIEKNDSTMCWTLLTNGPIVLPFFAQHHVFITIFTNKSVFSLPRRSAAVNVTLLAFTAERHTGVRRAADISCQQGTQQQTRQLPSIDGIHKRTDTRPLHRPSAAYRAGSVNNHIPQY